MISAARMCLAASAANCIISTAPIAKFGATNTLAPAPRRSSSAPASKPVVPITTWTPAATASWALATAVVGDREVDQHVGPAVGQRLASAQVQRRIGPGHQLHVVGAVDRLADGLAHPPGRARDRDADRRAGRRAAIGGSASGQRRLGGRQRPLEAVGVRSDAGGGQPLGRPQLVR